MSSMAGTSHTPDAFLDEEPSELRFLPNVRRRHVLVDIVFFFGLVSSFGAQSGTGHSAAAGDEVRRSAAEQTYWVEEIVSGLKFPYSLAWLPDGSQLVTEREGELRVIRNGRLDSRPVDGVPARFQNLLNGLKDLLLDPDFATNNTLYLLISEGAFEQHHTAIYRARYEHGGLRDVTRIFRAKEEMSGVGQSSARMIFLPDKTLLVGIPENHFYKPFAQRLDSQIGKILRINRDGSVPADNPLVNTAGALPEIWSYGHRVPTGIYEDPETHLIWEVEPGPRGGDELNLLKAGANFGWAKVTWGFDYSGGPVAPLQSDRGSEDPILVWTPSVTPSGLTRYRGKTFPAWSGDFFVGNLSGRALERLRIVDGKVILRERLLTDLGERVRHVEVGPDNRIYLLTDNANGRLLRLQPGTPSASELSRVAHKLDAKPPARDAYSRGDQVAAEPAKGKAAFVERCSACHSVGTLIRGGDVGPNLAGVYGRKAGAQPGFSFTPALANSSVTWKQLELDLFLNDPSYIQGTTMSVSVENAEIRRQIIEFLKQEAHQ